MDGYSLSKQYWQWAWENPSKNAPTHAALYFYLMEVCNRLGWKKEFGITTTEAMEAIGVSSHHTYRKSFNALVDAGLIVIVRKSKNQFQANIIALAKFAQPINGTANNAQPNDNGTANNANPEPKLVPYSKTIKNNTNRGVKKDKVKTVFRPPSFDEVREYASKRQRPDLAKPFFDYYDAGDWHDKDGKQVKNFKQKFITWENRNAKTEIPEQTPKSTKELWN